MEVTKENFPEILKELKNVIPQAEFLAIDGEFTGLSWPEISAFDTPANYYEQVRNGSQEFLLVQFGLCVFAYDQTLQEFTHRAYNFYIFPRPVDNRFSDNSFKSLPSSIHFLIENGFDFNKLYKSGIPYLRHEDEKRLREKLEEKHKASNVPKSSSNEDVSEVIPVPADKVEVIENMCSRIEDFLSDEGKKELALEGCNAFVRKLMYQEVSERFSSVRLETRRVTGGDRVLVASRKGSQEEELQRMKDSQEAEIQDLDAAVGFSHIIRLISQSGKLVIGHNMLLDLCMVINQFCTKLPESFQEFKQLVSVIFPRLLDTKYMSFCDPFKSLISSTVLSHLQKTLSEPPFEPVQVGFADKEYGYSVDSVKYHEAGYDAYVTGFCFLSMLNYLGSELKNEKLNLSASTKLKPYFNKIFLQKIQDSPFISIDEDEPEVRRDHVFHITFPKEWKTHDLVQLFNPFGRVFISWLNDTSAFVSLENRDQAKFVLRNLKQNNKFKVITFKRFQQLKHSSPPAKSLQLKPSAKRSRSSKESVIDYSGINTIPEEDEGMELASKGVLWYELFFINILYHLILLVLWYIVLERGNKNFLFFDGPAVLIMSQSIYRYIFPVFLKVVMSCKKNLKGNKNKTL